MGSTKPNYFSKEINVLKFLGVSLTEENSMVYQVYSILLLFPTLIVYPLLDFYEYFKHDTSAIANMIMYQMGTVLGFCKVTILLLNRDKFRKVLSKLENEPFALNIDRGGKVEEQLVRECVKLTTKQTYIFWTLTVVGYLIMIFSTFRSIFSQDYHDWQTPFGPFTLFNATYFTGYEINWLYQTIACTCISAQYITIDLILAAVLVHITYQFKILQNVIKQIVTTARIQMIADSDTTFYKPPNSYSIKNDGGDSSSITWQYLQKSTKETIKYHVAIIDISKEIEEVFSYALLIVFLGTLIFNTFSIYAASSASVQQIVVIKHIIEGFVACVQVAIICFWAEQVSQESQQVAKAVYESNFVGTDLRFQKMLSLIICRSQRPVKFSAGKFADISFATFAWILRTSYSSFMVLRSCNLQSRK